MSDSQGLVLLQAAGTLTPPQALTRFPRLTTNIAVTAEAKQARELQPEGGELQLAGRGAAAGRAGSCSW